MELTTVEKVESAVNALIRDLANQANLVFKAQQGHRIQYITQVSALGSVRTAKKLVEDLKSEATKPEPQRKARPKGKKAPSKG